MEPSKHINKTPIDNDKVLIESESQTQTLELSSFQRALKKYKQKPEVKEKTKIHSKTYYEKNREIIMEKQKKKREEDPEYDEYCRKKNIESMRRYREKKKLEKLRLLEEEKKNEFL